MRLAARILIALLCSIAAMILAFFLLFYLMLVLDPHYHDGIGFTVAIVAALSALIGTFILAMKKTKRSSDSSE